MSLNKAIQYKKEHRQPYRGGKAVSVGCRNHGSCPYCARGRQHKRRIKNLDNKDKLEDYFENQKRKNK